MSLCWYCLCRGVISHTWIAKRVLLLWISFTRDCPSFLLYIIIWWWLSLHLWSGCIMVWFRLFLVAVGGIITILTGFNGFGVIVVDIIIIWCMMIMIILRICVILHLICEIWLFMMYNVVIILFEVMVVFLHIIRAPGIVILTEYVIYDVIFKNIINLVVLI